MASALLRRARRDGFGLKPAPGGGGTSGLSEIRFLSGLPGTKTRDRQCGHLHIPPAKTAFTDIFLPQPLQLVFTVISARPFPSHSQPAADMLARQPLGGKLDPNPIACISIAGRRHGALVNTVTASLAKIDERKPFTRRCSSADSNNRIMRHRNLAALFQLRPTPLATDR